MFGQGLNFGGLTGSAGFDVDFLVIAGGAGGGSNGGGGGAGGLRTTTTYGGSESALTLSTSTPYSVTVGTGGAGLAYPAGYQLVGPPGSNSIFDTITSLGGGGGGSNNVNAANGGSGGGGGSTPSGSTAFGLGTSGQGNNGGAGGPGGHPYRGAGGGGSGSAGASSSTGAGGSGKSVSITGSAVVYAGGGGGTGGTQSGAGGPGGSGGGGAGGNGTGGAAGQNATILNSGSGGGSSGDAGPTGSGASGTVFLRYPTASVSSYAVTGTLDTVANTAYPIANTIYYKLNGGSGTTVTDSSGNGYNGTATSITYVAGRFGQAAQAGTSSRINTGYIQNGQVFTVSFWGKGAFGTGGSVFRDTPSVGGSNTFIDIATNSYGQPVFAGNVGLSPPGATPSAGWTHYCFVLDGSNSKIYVNSVEVATGTYTAKTGNNGTPVCIFANGLYTAGFASGIIDQARIFNSAISAANVTSLYNESTVVESIDGTDSILQFIGGSGDITFS